MVQIYFTDAFVVSIVKAQFLIVGRSIILEVANTLKSLCFRDPNVKAELVYSSAFKLDQGSIDVVKRGIVKNDKVFTI